VRAAHSLHEETVQVKHEQVTTSRWLVRIHRSGHVAARAGRAGRCRCAGTRC